MMYSSEGACTVKGPEVLEADLLASAGQEGGAITFKDSGHVFGIYTACLDSETEDSCATDQASKPSRSRRLPRKQRMKSRASISPERWSDIECARTIAASSTGVNNWGRNGCMQRYHPPPQGINNTDDLTGKRPQRSRNEGEYTSDHCQLMSD